MAKKVGVRITIKKTKEGSTWSTSDGDSGTETDSKAAIKKGLAAVWKGKGGKDD